MADWTECTGCGCKYSNYLENSNEKPLHKLEFFEKENSACDNKNILEEELIEEKSKLKKVYKNLESDRNN